MLICTGEGAGVNRPCATAKSREDEVAERGFRARHIILERSSEAVRRNNERISGVYNQSIEGAKCRQL